MDQPAVFQDRKPVRGSPIFWLRFLGIISFVIILLRLPTVGEVHLVHMDLRWLGFCMVLTLAQLLLEACVWQLLLWKQHIRHPYPKTLVAYLSGQYLGLVTPGHVGEFLAAGYISSETGITMGYALSSVVMKKVLNWVTIMAYGIWSFPLLADLPIGKGIQWILVTSAVVLMVLSLGILLWVVSLRRLARKWQKLSPWQVDITEFWSGIRHLTTPSLLRPLIVSATAFSILFLQLWSVLHALGVSLPFLLIAKIVAFSRIVARAGPLSVVGFGSKDAVIIGVLAQHGLDPAVGLTVTLLLLVSSYLITLLLSGLCWWIKPLMVRRVTSG